MSDQFNEVQFLKEGMIAIRFLARDVGSDHSRVIGDIADAMHNGFDPENPMGPAGLAGAEQGLQRLKKENPELQNMMSYSFAWASKKGADGCSYHV